MKPHTSPATSGPTTDSIAVFDVRPIPGRVKHAQIFQRWLDLPVGQSFILLNDHDPVPLRYQFEAEFPDTFSWEYVERGPEEFRVKITKRQPVRPPAPVPPVRGGETTTAVAADCGGRYEIDVRGLEPPEPLIRILDALEVLPAAATLHAQTDREPCHLFGEADQRGFRHTSSVQPDGSWITVLSRA